MTVGQRIAQKRKELGLSQEGLGERLGVSRQTVYKWESDAALPEIEKLVNLSREFSVSIDWLLGQGDETRELTPEQLRMVEEIVGRYLDARPASEETEGEPSQEEKRKADRKEERRAGFGLLGFMFKILLIVVAANVVVMIFWRMNEVEERYRSLQNSISNISSSVNSQISGITSRVEEVLQSQNALTAEQSAQVTAADYRANTVTVSARALPRTYVEGMTAEFTLVSSGETVTVPGQLGDDHGFTAQLTGPLSDDITVSVAFLSGDQRQTQLLGQFTGLYSDSFPEVNIASTILLGSGSKIEKTVSVFIPLSTDRQMISDIRVGLFRDKKLLAWYEHLDETPSNYGDEWSDHEFFRLDGEYMMEPGYEYCLAAVVTDVYGRELVYPTWPVVYDPETDFADYPEDMDFWFTSSPEEWDY